MAESKPFVDKFMESMGNLMTPEETEELRKNVEKVAEESLEGFQQLRTDIMNAASSMKQGANETLEKLESAFVDLQSNIENMQQKRRQQVIASSSISWVQYGSSRELIILLFNKRTYGYRLR